MVKYGNQIVHNYTISYLYENEGIVSISNLVMTALSAGTTRVVATATYIDFEVSESFIVTVY